MSLRRPAELGLQFAVLALPLVIALLSSDKFVHDSVAQTLLAAGLALSWNLIGGFAGQISIGHVAFFGIGAYTSTLLGLRLGLTPWLGMLIGGAIAAACGVLLGLVTFRLKGTFFAMATLAFAEVLRMSAVNAKSLTNGSEGLFITATPDPAMFVFAEIRSYVVVIWLIVVLLYAFSFYVARSRLGLCLHALRDEEAAARSLGVNSIRVRLLMMAISAFATAICGTFYAQFLLFVDPDSVLGPDLSIQMALAAVVGGVGTAFGPVLGTFLVVPFGQFLRAELGGQFVGLHLVVYGFGLLLVLYKLPDGLWRALRGLLGWTDEDAGDVALPAAPAAAHVKPQQVEEPS
jgi:branched-chain amino acid transport system permease protein